MQAEPKDKVVGTEVVSRVGKEEHVMTTCGLVITVKGAEPGGCPLNSGWWPQGRDLGEKENEEDKWHQKEKSEL